MGEILGSVLSDCDSGNLPPGSVSNLEVHGLFGV